MVLAGLRSAVATGLVVVPATDTDTFRFRHALTCEAVRTDLLPPERRALARAAAAVVERREPAARDLAAGLWMAAGEDARAAELYLRAGWQSRRRGALHTAEAQLTRAATLAVDKPALRREAEAVLVEVLADAGDTDRAMALGERLLARGETWVRLTLAEVAAEAGRWDVAASRLSALPKSDDPRASVLAARLAHERGQPEDALSIARLALTGAEERNQWPVACQALEVMGRTARVTDLEAARDAFLTAERLAIDHDLPLERVSALHELGTVDLLLDGSTIRLARARALALDAGALGLAATSTYRSRPACCTRMRTLRSYTPSAAPSLPADCEWTSCGPPRCSSRPPHTRTAETPRRWSAAWPTPASSPRTTWTSTPASGARCTRTSRCSMTTGPGWPNAWTTPSSSCVPARPRRRRPRTVYGRSCAPWTTARGSRREPRPARPG